MKGRKKVRKKAKGFFKMACISLKMHSTFLFMLKVLNTKVLKNIVVTPLLYLINDLLNSATISV